jgi:hypothetical protein
MNLTATIPLPAAVLAREACPARPKPIRLEPTIAYELVSHLSNVVAFSELLRDRLAADDQSYADALTRNALQSQQLLSQLLDNCFPAGLPTRAAYSTPAIVYETRLTTRAGSPFSAFRPEQDPADLWSK